jgi:hypothetical protein
MTISEHISYREATKSVTAIRRGIDNDPNQVQLAAMRLVAETVFEPVRLGLGGKPIGISSFFRCELLNRIIGGAPSSQHTKGEAIDIDADILRNGITNRAIFSYIKDNLTFDQLIWEFGNDREPDWVHVSRIPGGNRGEILKAIRDKDGSVRYKFF